MNSDSDYLPISESEQDSYDEVIINQANTIAKKKGPPPKKRDPKTQSLKHLPKKSQQKEEEKEEFKDQPKISKKKKYSRSATERRREQEQQFGPIGYFYQDFQAGEKKKACEWLEGKLNTLIAQSHGLALTPKFLKDFLNQAEFYKLHKPESHAQILRNMIKDRFEQQFKTKGTKLYKTFISLYDAVIQHITVPKPMIQQPMFFPSKQNEIHLARILRRAKKSLYVCIFTFTNNRLAEALIDRFKQGIDVQVITDDQCSKFMGADIYRLGALGVPCSMDNNARFHMHNKFAIIDMQFLVTGSFNWSSQAVTGNQENLIVVDNRQLCRQYKLQFDKLWKQFQPNQLKQNFCVSKVIEEMRVKKQKQQERAKKREEKMKLKKKK